MYYSNNNEPGLAWKRYVFTCLFILLCLSSFANKLGFNFINDKNQTTVSFTLIGNLIVIPVRVNEQINVNLVLDTGGRSLILFGKKFQKLLEVLPDREIRLTGYGNKAYRLGKLSANNKISIADIEGNGVGIILTENKNFFPSSQGTAIHGIIGYQIFSRFVVKIDYAKGEIILAEPMEYIEKDTGFQVVDLVVKDTKPYIKASFDNSIGKKEAFFHIDTGSSKEIILFIKGAQKETSLDYSSEQALVGKGLNGYIYGHKGDRISLSFSNGHLDNIHPYYIQRTFSDREIDTAAGSIGSGLLKGYIIILDYVNQKFYFKKVVT